MHLIHHDGVSVLFTTDEIRILQHGLKWIPHPDETDARKGLSQGIDDFIVRADLQTKNISSSDLDVWKEAYIYAHRKTIGAPMLSMDSAAIQNDPVIGPYAEHIRHVFEPHMGKQLKGSLTDEQKRVRKAIRNIRNSEQWVVKPADKNQGICLIELSIYITMLMTIVQDAETYHPVNEGDARDLIRGVAVTWNQICDRHESVIKSSQMFKDIVDFAGSPVRDIMRDSEKWYQYTSRMYAIPKVHKGKKDGVYSTRPLVQGFSCVQARMNRILARILYPLLSVTTSAILETTHAREAIQKFSIGNQIGKVFTADVEALYPNVPVDKVEESYRILIQEVRDCQWSEEVQNLHSWIWNDDTVDLVSDWIGCSLEPVVIRTILPFNTSFYRQAKGLPMGYSLSPWAACTVLWALCERPNRDLIHSQTWLFGRYIDDICLVTRADSVLDSKSSVERWLKIIYTDRLESIRLTVNQGAGTGSVPFLDLDIVMDNSSCIVDKMETVCFNKTTSLFRYIEESSLHPHQIFKATVQQEARRMMATTSRMERLQTTLRNVSIRYIQRDYHVGVIWSWIQETARKQMQKGWSARSNYHDRSSLRGQDISVSANPFVIAAGFDKPTDYIRKKPEKEASSEQLLPLRIPYTQQLQQLRPGKKLHDAHRDACRSLTATRAQLDPANRTRLNQLYTESDGSGAGKRYARMA